VDLKIGLLGRLAVLIVGLDVGCALGAGEAATFWDLGGMLKGEKSVESSLVAVATDQR
jgi:hypothetical protein